MSILSDLQIEGLEVKIFKVVNKKAVTKLSEADSVSLKLTKSIIIKENAIDPI